MQVQVEHAGTKGTLFVEEAGNRLAGMTFTMAGETLTNI